ncbi:hypothetical protein [Bradyrhizobium sp. USDA 4473]
MATFAGDRELTFVVRAWISGGEQIVNAPAQGLRLGLEATRNCVLRPGKRLSHQRLQEQVGADLILERESGPAVDRVVTEADFAFRFR